MFRQRSKQKSGILDVMIPISTVSRPVEIGLRLTGIWPNSPIFFRLLWTLVMGTGLIFQYHYLLTHFSTKDLPNLIDGLSTTLPYSLLFFKLIVLWVKNRIFNNILTAMSNDWHEYSGMYTMIDKAVLAHRCSKLTIGVYSTAVMLYSTASINFRKQSNNNCRELLIKMELPFEFCESPIYEIVAGVQFVHLMAVASAIGMLDALMVTLMLHIGGQIDIMRQEADEICPKDNKYDLPVAIVKSLISKHHKIIAFSESIESLFSHIAFMQFFSNTIIICCIGFLIVTSLGTDEGVRMLVKTMFFYIAITLEAFIFCFAGEYLSNKSKTIGDAVYESVWYNLKPQDCRILLFVIMRSQRRLTITAGKFIDLSLEGFTNSKTIGDAAYESVWYDLKPRHCRILLFVIMRSQRQLTLTAGKFMDLSFEGFTDILHTSGQIEILCDSLRDISFEKNNQHISFSMKELIGKHQKIIIFSGKIERIFSYVALIQFLSSTLLTCCVGFTVITILHTSGQIEILCDALRDIFLEKNNQQISFSVKELISKHQKIIIFSDKIERIFSYIALVEFLASILLTCCVGFTVITVTLLKAIVFYIAALIEAFIFCFCGEYLSSKSKMISDAAYKSIWYDFKPNDSKLILLIILRSQKRLTITAGRIMDLSLEGFTNIMKASVSYGSVLHAMY
ncbi:uncharacterized protein LOC105831969 [Monomorium pharaonis]|uniref:uncharacterized protein LOC105831969 n=1 Tax=Monomorium pharaonis TaxID=307658 RepID=UPI0017479947|nr:uncharacterized protein LOC105831969 [Monomorium pharaonis]